MDDYDNAEALAAQFQTRLSTMDGDGGGEGASVTGTSRGGRRGGRGGGGRGGGRSGGDARGMSREKEISHALSRLLRHQAANAGIALDAEGYAPLADVLQWGPLRALKVSVGEVRAVIATNDKQRFAWKLGAPSGDAEKDAALLETGTDAAAFVIRANQGHSIASVASDAGLLKAITDAATAPRVVCHGTYFAAWPAIEASGGLKRMARNHVHMGCLDEGGEEGATIPGVRRNAQVLVYVDVRRALREAPELKWWRAANGVVLSEGDADGVVPTRFFRRVVTAGEQVVLWEDGRKVADLPADVVSRGGGQGGGRGHGRGRGRGRPQ